MHVGIVRLHRLGNLLQQGGFTGLRRGDNHSSLPLSHRADQIHDAHGHRGTGKLQADPFLREDRRHVFKAASLCGDFRRVSVDALDIEQGAEFLILGLHAGVSHDDISGLEPEPADLTGRHIDVILAGKVIGTADKTVAVRHNLQNSVCRNAAVQLGREALLRRYLYCRSFILCRSASGGCAAGILRDGSRSRCSGSILSILRLGMALYMVLGLPCCLLRLREPAHPFPFHASRRRRGTGVPHNSCGIPVLRPILRLPLFRLLRLPALRSPFRFFFSFAFCCFRPARFCGLAFPVLRTFRSMGRRCSAGLCIFLRSRLLFLHGRHGILAFLFIERQHRLDHIRLFHG